MRPIVTDSAWSASLLVCHERKLCGTAEPIGMLFIMWIEGAKETVGVLTERAAPLGIIGGYDLPAVDVVNLIRQRAGAMRPLTTSLL